MNRHQRRAFNAQGVSPTFAGSVDRSCALSSCSAPGRWMPVLWVWAHVDKIRTPDRGAGIDMGCCLCDAHKDELKPEHLLSDEGKETIAKVLSSLGKGVPDYSATRLAFRDLDDPICMELPPPHPPNA